MKAADAVPPDERQAPDAPPPAARVGPRATLPPVVVALEGVTKRFGGVTAVDGVDLALRAGEVHAVVGENGAGKSTLMRLIDGLVEPDEGRILVDGAQVRLRSARDARGHGIAMIPQELELFGELSVVENLFVGQPRPRRRWGAFDTRAMRRTARAVLGSLGVDVDVTVPVGRLPAATRQLVEIARALVRDARVLIMDEPTAALTDREARRLFAAVADLTARGVAVVYISHRLDEVFAVADRVTVLRDGRHVRTAAAADLAPAEVVRLMVGRTLNAASRRQPYPPGPPAITVRGLSSPGAFADVDLVVRRGEVVALSGLLGAGRSELAQCLVGLRPVTAGTVLVGDTPRRIRSPREALDLGIAYVPEERRSQGLVLPFSVAANISFSSLDRLTRAGFVLRGRERELAADLARRVTVRGAEVDAPVQRLSGGNQQKVLLAKALARDPDVLILDEPTRGVDVGAKAEIYELIDGMARVGKALLVISSELAEVLALADRVVVMREGQVAGVFPRAGATQERLAAAAAGVPVDGGGERP